MKIHKLLKNKTHWCQHANAKNEKGYSVHALDPDARSWCLRGAAVRCYGHDQENMLRVLNKIRYMLADKFGVVSVRDWNDRNSTEYKDVKSVVTFLDV